MNMRKGPRGETGPTPPPPPPPSLRLDPKNQYPSTYKYVQPGTVNTGQQDNPSPLGLVSTKKPTTTTTAKIEGKKNTTRILRMFYHIYTCNLVRRLQGPKFYIPELHAAAPAASAVCTQQHLRIGIYYT